MNGGISPGPCIPLPGSRYIAVTIKKKIYENSLFHCHRHHHIRHCIWHINVVGSAMDQATTHKAGVGVGHYIHAIGVGFHGDQRTFKNQKINFQIMAWYDLNEERESKSQYLARIKYENILCKRAESFMNIVDGELLPNIQYRIITENGFNAISVIEYLRKFYELTDIYIAVYRMNQLSANKIKQFIDDDTLKCGIVLSSFFRQNKKYEKWCHDLLLYAKSKPNVQISFAWNHAKVFLAKTKDDKYIVLEGSGNLSDNARIEQYIIEDNKITYEFHKNWITEILNKNTGS